MASIVLGQHLHAAKASFLLAFPFPFIPQKEGTVLVRFAALIVDFLKREDGPTTVEYAVMLALIVAVCITSITSLGNNANRTFTSVSTKLGGAGS
jgi:pilus assembly protein Flp/PilA